MASGGHKPLLSWQETATVAEKTDLCAIIFLWVTKTHNSTRRRVRGNNTIPMTKAAHASICVGSFVVIEARLIVSMESVQEEVNEPLGGCNGKYYLQIIYGKTNGGLVSIVE
jgi:hypothetical protein